MCEVTYFPLVSLQVKKSHSESHVPDPSDVRYTHTFAVRKKEKKKKTLTFQKCVFVQLYACLSFSVMVQRGEVSLHLELQ